MLHLPKIYARGPFKRQRQDNADLRDFAGAEKPWLCTGLI